MNIYAQQFCKNFLIIFGILRLKFKGFLSIISCRCCWVCFINVGKNMTCRHSELSHEIFYNIFIIFLMRVLTVYSFFYSYHSPCKLKTIIVSKKNLKQKILTITNGHCAEISPSGSFSNMVKKFTYFIMFFKNCLKFKDFFIIVRFYRKSWKRSWLKTFFFKCKQFLLPWNMMLK